MMQVLVAGMEVVMGEKEGVAESVQHEKQR